MPQPSREGVHVIDAARVWNRSKREDKSRAERGLLQVLADYEELQHEDHAE